MVIAVALMGMVQMAADEVIDMSGMRHRLVSTPGFVPVPRVMLTARMGRRAGGWIAPAGLQPALIDVIAVHTV